MISKTGAEDHLIALGANIPSVVGPPEETLRAAVVRLREAGLSDLVCSRFYSTPCFPPGAGPDYVNAAARASFQGSAQEVLATLHAIEAEFGRERKQRWGQRCLDLDLIASGQEVLPDRKTYDRWRGLDPALQREETPGEMILPHPRVQDRAFVLIPLADVAPDWRHPILGQTVAEMVEMLDAEQVADVRPI